MQQLYVKTFLNDFCWEKLDLVSGHNDLDACLKAIRKLSQHLRLTIENTL